MCKIDLSKTKVGVAVSGGVDSLYSLLYLRDCGCNVTAVHGLFLDSKDQDIDIINLKNICNLLNIKFINIDLRQQFKERVIKYFVSKIFLGLTPNPCVVCNKEIKFNILKEFVFSLGVDLFATGHYVKCLKDNTISVANDLTRDQSYFVSFVPKDGFDGVVFPLCNFRKKDIINFLQQFLNKEGIDFNIKYLKESRDICFVPKGKNKLEELCIKYAKEFKIDVRDNGDILLDIGNGKISYLKQKHNGLWRYTEGQRRGLNIAWIEGLYILKKMYSENIIVVGPRFRLGMFSCIAKNINLFLDISSWTGDIFVKLRYRQQAIKAKIKIFRDMVKIFFDVPCFPTSPGQLAVFYSADGIVLASAEVAIVNMLCDTDIENFIAQNISQEKCLDILYENNVPYRGVLHGFAVGYVAKVLTEKLNECEGFARLNAGLALAGGLLHDLAKDQFAKEHEIKGGEILKNMRLFRIADIVREHRDCFLADTDLITEKELVCLADKYCRGKTFISLQERFECKRKEYGYNDANLQAINAREKRALNLAKRYQFYTDIDPEVLAKEVLTNLKFPENMTKK